MEAPQEQVLPQKIWQMCGIVGFLKYPPDWGLPQLQEVTHKMAAALIHRGPDDDGLWVDAEAGLALAHRRLAIIDLSQEGRQPMLSACGRYIIVYNGEIYNYLDIKKQLQAEAGQEPLCWRGHSDTEVMLAAIARSLMERRESVVVQILAARNTLEGEQVNVEFARPQPNRRIFRANDEITHRIVDGTLSDADIYTELLSMLQDVRAEARSRGLIPTLPGGKFGEIPHTELFPVLHQVQAARGPVRVRVLAARETWTADPLQIRFVVGEDRS